MALQGRMTRFKLQELSGVDRPAQSGARVAIMKREESMFDPVIKRDFSDEKRKELADRGLALPDGSFPIESEQDLHNAVRAIGRAKDEAKAKGHIISRAKSMGMTSALPDGWVKKEFDMTGAEIRKALGLPETASDAEVITAQAAKLAKAEDDMEKAKKEAADAEKQARKAGMSAAEKEHTSGMSDGDADDFMSKSKPERDKLMAKRLEGEEILELDGQKIKKSAVDPGVFALLKSQSEQIVANAKAVAKAAEATAEAGFRKRAMEEFAHVAGSVDDRVLTLKHIAKVRETDAKGADAMEAILKAAEGTAKFAFQRAGSGGGLSNPADGNGAATQLDNMARDYAKTASVSFAKAYDAVSQTPAGKELYEKIVAEKRNGARPDQD